MADATYSLRDNRPRPNPAADPRVCAEDQREQVVNWTQPADWNGGSEGPGRRITGPGTMALQAYDATSAVLY